MRIVKSVFLCLFLLLISICTVDASMKKGNVASGKYKGYVFSTYENGPCTVDVIYDSASADIDVAMGVSSGSDAVVVCMGVSTQKNHDSCTTSLPGGTVFFIVDSYRGSSPFRVVVDCASDESASNAGRSSSSETIQEIDPNSIGNKFLQQIKNLQKTVK